MPQLFTNNAFGSLAGSVNGAATTFVLASGNGAKFPAPTGGDYFLATLIGLDGNGAESAWEIVKCTARSTDQLTVVRAQEGTTATTWNAGTRIEIRWTAASIAGKEDSGTASSSMTTHLSAVDPHSQYSSTDHTHAVATVSVNGLMASTDKTKLDGIASGATNYSHPTNHAPSIITQDSSNRFVTDTEKTTWNAKASPSDISAALSGKSDTAHTHSAATTGAPGFMSAADKTKLDGIAASANNYAHPANHPASIITQDSSNRFVTDAEKAAWNSKLAAASYATSSVGGTVKVRLNGTIAYFTTNGNNA